MLLLFLKTSNRFLKVVAVRHSRWKVFQKQTFHLTSTIYLLRCLTEKQIQLINIKTTHPISLTFFSNFPSCDSCVFIFIVFCISSIKVNRISCGIFYHSKVSIQRIIIQLSSSGIFLGLWSKG